MRFGHYRDYGLLLFSHRTRQRTCLSAQLSRTDAIERQINSGFDRLAKVLSTQAATYVESDSDTPTKTQQVGGHKYQLQLGRDIDKGQCASLSKEGSSFDTLFKMNALGANAAINVFVKGTNNLGYAFVQYLPLLLFNDGSLSKY